MVRERAKCRGCASSRTGTGVGWLDVPESLRRRAPTVSDREWSAEVSVCQLAARSPFELGLLSTATAKDGIDDCHYLILRLLSRVLFCACGLVGSTSLPMLARLPSRSGRVRATPALLLSSPANTSSRISRFVPQRTLSSTASPPPPSRLRRYAVRTALAALGLGVAYELDKEYHASAIIRNVRTLWTVSNPLVALIHQYPSASCEPNLPAGALSGYSSPARTIPVKSCGDALLLGRAHPRLYSSSSHESKDSLISLSI